MKNVCIRTVRHQNGIGRKARFYVLYEKNENAAILMETDYLHLNVWHCGEVTLNALTPTTRTEIKVNLRLQGDEPQRKKPVPSVAMDRG